MPTAKNPGIGPDDPFREAMQSLIAVRFRSLWTSLPVAAAGVDPEGVHDVRVASRRLRAAMDVAAEAFPEPWFRQLHRTAKAITTELGAVRDRDVLLEFLTKERAHAPANEHAGIDRLIARVESERDEARGRMLAFLEKLDAAGAVNESIARFGKDAAPAADRKGAH